jgi:hypothetical protein
MELKVAPAHNDPKPRMRVMYEVVWAGSCSTGVSQVFISASDDHESGRKVKGADCIQEGRDEGAKTLPQSGRR